MGTGVTESRLLTDKTHRDGSPLSRYRIHAAKMSPSCRRIEDKAIVSDLSSCSSDKSSIRIPIKMLIAHEMSREMDSNHKSPSLVAKLMGLDALPRQESDSALQQESQSHHYCHSDIPSSNWQQDDEMEMQMPRELHNYLENSEYKDVYEVFHHSHEGMLYENSNEKKMALVRQKFIEAKRLATDEKLCQSNRFQDALDVLSSNRDLFLKLLQETNSLITQQHLPSVPPSETQRITVLKPTKLVESNKIFRSHENEKQTTRASDASHKVGRDENNHEFSPTYWKFIDNPAQPTRIVVLKPSIGKVEDIKEIVSPRSLSPRFLQSDDFLGEPEDDDAEKSREVIRHQSNDTLLSSVFSNGYIGDESSFHKSESEYVLGYLSDCEHSWDYIDRVGSPFSSSSFCPASCSPESLTRIEAKKRLSERWAMVASNVSCIEQQKHARRSSSTLGEMLGLSDPKSSVICKEGTSRKQEGRSSTSCLINDKNGDENDDNSSMNLLRSKSVPVSSTMLEDTLNLKVTDSEFGKTDTSKEVAKSKSIKTSLKGKVSSFFLRSKRSNKEKTSPSQSKNELDTSCRSNSDSTTRGLETKAEEGWIHDIQSLSNTTPSRDSNGVEERHRIVFPEEGLSVAKPVLPRNPRDNQDQPSPVSVLEQLFEEDGNIRSFPCNVKPCDHGASLLGHSLRSNLIDRSPPIGSVSRTLSRDNSRVDKRTEYALPPSTAPNVAVEGEQEWLFFVQSLLSAIGLGGKVQSDSYIARWHSPHSPLDPSLRDSYVDLNEKGITHEGKRRQMRSTRKLVFDCVNTILGDMTGDESDMSMRDIPNDVGGHERILDVELVDRVWSRMREWFAVEVGCDDVDQDSLVVERVVRKEVVGKGWAEHMRAEIDNIGKEIEGELLEEFVNETVVKFSSGFRIFG